MVASRGNPGYHGNMGWGVVDHIVDKQIVSKATFTSYDFWKYKCMAGRNLSKKKKYHNKQLEPNSKVNNYQK